MFRLKQIPKTMCLLLIGVSFLIELHKSKQFFIKEQCMIDKYADQASDWDKPSKSKMTDRFVETMLANVTFDKNWRALEIGAGTGLVGMGVVAKIDSIVFEDTSTAMLEVLQKKITPALSTKIEILNGEVFEYMQQDIDLAFSCMAFHHIENLEEVIAHLSQILKSNALLVIGDIRTEDGSFHHFNAIPHKGFDTDALSVLLGDVGFDVQSILDYNIINKEVEPGKYNDFQQFMLIARRI